jgi:hypothetical protein
LSREKVDVVKLDGVGEEMKVEGCQSREGAARATYVTDGKA